MNDELHLPLYAIKSSIHDRLSSLALLITDLGDDRYGQSLDILSGGTVGKHVRHIIEFYQMLLAGLPQGLVCYDDRSHNQAIETQSQAAIDQIRAIQAQITLLIEDQPIHLQANYTTDPANRRAIPSSLTRELAYNLDHTVHHFAVIKLAIKYAFHGVEIPTGFDLAYSTINYQAARA